MKGLEHKRIKSTLEITLDNRTMAEGEILNKVANSPLITFNLEDFMPAGVCDLDISQFLEGGYVLREKNFRDTLKIFDYSPFQGRFVRVFCSTDSILPAWAALLVASKLCDHQARSYWASSEESFYSQYYREHLSQLNWDDFTGKPVIIKGCGDPRVPQDAYVFATSKMKQVAKKISYGEACSAVPLK